MPNQLQARIGERADPAWPRGLRGWWAAVAGVAIGILTHMVWDAFTHGGAWGVDLVALHGTGGSGRDMVSAFHSLAEEYAFVIVAPDSRRSPDGQLTWQVGDKPGDVTPDFTHIVACLDEFRRFRPSQALLQNVLIAGHSGGASSAPYLATNHDSFAAFAVLHGGVFPGGLGGRVIRGWFSTGASDPLRSPAHVKAAADSAREKNASAIVYREFPGGHGLSAAETRSLVEWWLKG